MYILYICMKWLKKIKEKKNNKTETKTYRPFVFNFERK